ncbi:BTB domain-containing protein [Mycena venus]|uniref:BTB domain-containing protein n=1 Tax=Mycena venus TaxID=2733690 RepID=A0A8H6Z4A2_9AGAR|nr:BTB domain-containing protein [Mycena venus]
MSSVSEASPAADKVPVFVPTSPFDSPDADIILRSCDGADFRLHKAVLSLVSPVFRDMFTLPQPESALALPVVDVSEGSAVLDRALRFFYPGAQPIVQNLDELGEIIGVLVQKYDMQCIVPTAKQYLERHAVYAPLPAYAIAYKLQWKDVATAAAKQTLKHRLRALDTLCPPALENLPASAYYNLIRYHYLCGLAAKDVTAGMRWVAAPNDHVWFSCRTCTEAPLAWYLSDNALHNVRIWFNAFLERVGGILVEAPDIDIENHALVYDALKTAAQCSICRAKVFEQFPQWVRTSLKPQIVVAIEKACP